MEENNEYAVREVSAGVFPRVFLWMFLGLFATGLISYFTYSTGFIENMLNSQPMIFPIILIVELVVVLLFSFL